MRLLPLRGVNVETSIEHRVQSYLRAALSGAGKTEQVGPFLAMTDPSSAGTDHNYAVPDDDASPTPREIVELVNWYERRSRTPRLQYVPATAPLAEQALIREGFAVEGRLALMTATSEDARRRLRPPRIEVVSARDEQTLMEAAAAQHEAYGKPESTEADIGRLMALVRSGGAVLLARDLATGEAAGAGLYSVPIDGVTEIAAVGVRPRFRRRGIAFALAAELTHAAFQSGVVLPFLMAAHPAEEHLYMRAGFATVSEVLRISRRVPG